MGKKRNRKERDHQEIDSPGRDRSASESEFDDDGEFSDRDAKRSKKSRHHKKKKKKQSRKRSRRDDSSESDSFSGDDSYSSYDSCHDRKRSKKKKKRSKKKSKKRRKDRHQDGEKPSPDQNGPSQQLADALLDLFTKHPGMAEDLPILLIRLCSGSTFSLDQSKVQVELERVLSCLESYGVEKDVTGVFSWHAPRARDGSMQSRNHELTLIRVVRALLDQIGLNVATVLDHEHGRLSASQKPEEEETIVQSTDRNGKAPAIEKPTASKDIPALVQRIMHSFPGLEKELIGLCRTILSGESVALDGIENEALREALSRLLEVCHLEQSEMEIDEEEEEDDDEEDGSPTLGFSLPDGPLSQVARESIDNIINACEAKATRVLGPMRPPPSYKADSDNEEEEGPQLTPRGPAPISKAELEKMAKRRQIELQSVKAGVDPSVAAMSEEGGREEWMLVPGKFDFLDSVKVGHRSREFQNVKANEGEQDSEPAMDPKIQAEMDQLMAEHQDSRGPSLMDEHQAAKKQEEKGKANKEWKWNRNKDLDAGRRVDKDALNMVLGGAASGLKTKFQGGFHSRR